MKRTILSGYSGLLFVLLGAASCLPQKNVVQPPPEERPAAMSDFTWYGSQIAPATISFRNQSTEADSFLWYFGDGEHSTVVEPQHIYVYPGTYPITLIAFGADSTKNDTARADLSIVPVPSPHAEFTWSGDTRAPAIITFRNQSTYADTFFWNFGNGQTSALANPQITFETVGSYGITLIAASSRAEPPDTARKTIVIAPSYFTLDSLVLESVLFVDTLGDPWDPGNGPDIFLNLRNQSTVLVWSSIGAIEENVETDSLPLGWKMSGDVEIDNWQETFKIEVFDYDRTGADEKMVEIRFSIADLAERYGYIENYVISQDGFSIRLKAIWS